MSETPSQTEQTTATKLIENARGRTGCKARCNYVIHEVNKDKSVEIDIDHTMYFRVSNLPVETATYFVNEHFGDVETGLRYGGTNHFGYEFLNDGGFVTLLEIDEPSNTASICLRTHVSETALDNFLQTDYQTDSANLAHLIALPDIAQRNKTRV